jgi:ABC-type dipeptide/oligopeptide/nickel transport system permease subunit
MSGRLRFLRSPGGLIGAIVLLLALLIALFGPLFAPHSPDAPVGVPLAGPSGDAPLGTDSIGRDVLSRVLYGGRSVVVLALLATVLAYAAGIAIGLIAGYKRTLADPMLMRSVDVLLAFPPLLFLLVLVTAVGTSEAALVVGVAIVQMPGIARLVRTVTLEVSVRGYVEAALMRGERTTSILRREVLPNITPAILADAGLRFTFSVLFIAAANFLTIGLQPPQADWGLMINENRRYISLNPWAVAAPAAMIAALTIGVNLMGDAIARSLGRSAIGGRRRRAA